MHAIINHLPMKPGTDWQALGAQIDAFSASIRHAGYRGLSLIRAGDNEAIIVVLFSDRAALEEVSRDVAGPWFAANMKQHLAGPARRSVGEIIAGTLTFGER